ncbi:MAG TPA: DUF6131 family protein [Jatrophihabitans sp.]|jgi:uncharacterized membrane protein HdeD (DUF308 family)|nr:DUF6131 family protein [Jatrophihabitans sp.]
MIILGVVLLLIGLLFKITIAFSLGVIALVIGIVLALAGRLGYSVGPRRHYY